MKQFAILLAISIFLIYHNLNAQYYQYYLGDPYSTSIVFDNTFTLPKPTDSYQSLRTQVFGAGSFDLIQNDYSDHFRNPAYQIEGNKKEIFGNLGSIQENGKFILGGFVPIADKSLGISINLEGMRKNKSTDAFDYYFLNQNSIDTYTNENSPKKYGTRLSFSSPINSKVTAGASYHFLKLEEINRTSGTRRNSDSLYFYDYLRLLDYSKFGTIHKIDVGTLLNFSTFILDLKTTVLLSSHQQNSKYERIYRSLFSTEYYNRLNPTDIDTRGGLISAVLSYTSPDNRDRLRFLTQSGYTAYDIKGISTRLDTVRYSSGITYKSISNSTREGDGYVLDIRSGCGYEKYFSETITAYAAISVNYILHKTNISEKGYFSYTTATVNISKTPSEKLEIIDIRLPVALEYFYGDHLILRGGVEPRYQTGEIINSFLTNEIYNNITNSYNQKFKTERNGLSLTSNFGATLKHNDYGVVDFLFGNVLTDTNFWLISIRVFI